jgi:hypothetical protein
VETAFVRVICLSQNEGLFVMGVVIKRKAGPCSLCGETIEEGEECLSYFNKNRKAGAVHYRHFKCQYARFPRNCSLEEYIKVMKTDDANRKKNLENKKLERLLVYRFEDQIVKCPKCDQLFLKDNPKSLKDHLAGKHGIKQW